MLQNSNENLAVHAAGAVIPKIGLGTWRLRGEQCSEIVAAALRAGYTHIDTAQGYANEEFVGEGFVAAGAARSRVFITTKVRPDRLADGDLQRSVDESLSKLRMSQIDLLLIHWPNPEVPLKDTIRALNAVKRDGRARHIGLSNFTSGLLEEAWRLTDEPFAAEQIEYHPYLDQRKMLAALRRHGMAIIAYCPIAIGKVVGDPEIEAIATAHGRTAAQVTLRWLSELDVAAIPKTGRTGRLAAKLNRLRLRADRGRDGADEHATWLNRRNVNEPRWVAEWD